MKYRIIVDLCFDKKSVAEKVLSAANFIKNDAVNPFRDENNPSISIEKKIELWECYHDEDPPKQCKRII